MNKDNNQIRAFIAISIPKEIINFLYDIQGKLQKYGVKASWANPSNMHVTLKFFGNINVSRIDAIKECMIKAVAGIPIHSLFISGIGVFPSVKKTKVIWSEISGQTDVLERLADRLEELFFMEMEIEKEKRKFSPHLTLARVKQPIYFKSIVKLQQEFKDFNSEKFLVSKINFFQSELTSFGAVHKIIFSAPFTE